MIRKLIAAGVIGASVIAAPISASAQTPKQTYCNQLKKVNKDITLEVQGKLSTNSTRLGKDSSKLGSDALKAGKTLLNETLTFANDAGADNTAGEAKDWEAMNRTCHIKLNSTMRKTLKSMGG